MSVNFSPAQHQPGPADALRARREQELLRSELTRVRSAALAWRNGLAALLAGLIGFGLVRGRSDISALNGDYAVAVGLLLLLALVLGGAAAYWLMAAAHGLPRVIPLGSQTPPTDHQEAVSSARRLRNGVVATFLCTIALIAAVATLWYGPPADAPAIHITLPDGTTQCASTLTMDPQGARLTTDHGTLVVPPSSTSTIRAGKPC
ncbi:hypothetical protein [Streptacidiphilus alkalitolerans]|uniref:hypothetical protein n=1 Tax=Streptacidiphilus alkalitolerans TaxID=3342712 RepID=UPI0036D368A8